jgi:hypothetical protein
MQKVVTHVGWLFKDPARAKLHASCLSGQEMLKKLLRQSNGQVEISVARFGAITRILRS